MDDGELPAVTLENGSRLDDEDMRGAGKSEGARCCWPARPARCPRAKSASQSASVRARSSSWTAASWNTDDAVRRVRGDIPATESTRHEDQQEGFSWKDPNAMLIPCPRKWARARAREADARAGSGENEGPGTSYMLAADGGKAPRCGPW